MVKFGEFIKEGLNPEWKEMYMDYDKLKDMIIALEQKHFGEAPTGKGIALSVPAQTNAAGIPVDMDPALASLTQEQFYSFLEQEMRKIEQFTKKMVYIFFESPRTLIIVNRSWK